MKPIAYIAAAALLLPILAIVAWTQMYNQPDDPKNLRYVLWKHGLAPMDMDDAASAITFDADRENMLLGRSDPQLRGRFGYLVPIERAAPLYQRCLDESGWAKEGRLFFIRQSGLVVVFKKGIATNVINTKSC